MGLAASLSMRTVAAALLAGAASVAAQTIDYDDDDDGLIDVRSLVQLYAIRWDLNGNGAADNASDATSYANAFPTPATGMGCPAAGCSGYELRRNLDFDTDGDGDVDGDDPGSYTNFGTIGGVFNDATFRGNGHTITNLRISATSGETGMFSQVGGGGTVRGVGLINPTVSSSATGQPVGTGALVGKLFGSVIGCYVIGGTVSSTAGANMRVGGLVGWNDHLSSTVTLVRTSYSTASVSGTSSNPQIGGLVGSNQYTATIRNSYAAGDITSNHGLRGGLVGVGFNGNFHSSYWDNTIESSVGDSVSASLGKTTSELQTPTTYDGIYAAWDDTDGDAWDFGTSTEYPVLKIDGHDPRDQQRRGLRLSATALAVVQGGSASYSIRLNTRPSAEVTVTVGGATEVVTVDADDGMPGDQATLRFTATNWRTERTVTVRVADSAPDGERLNLTHSAAGGDYSGLPAGRLPSLSVTVGTPPPPPPDYPPVAVGTFADVALDPGERLEVSLSGKFRDPEGGALTYSAGTSNAEVAEAGVSDGQLWVQGRSPGTARVVVTATDAGGLSTFSGFLVQVGMVVSFAADASAPEGGTLRLRLIASQPADGDLSVAYALAASGDEASAADESDHDGGSGGMATIASGEMEAEIEIGILDDARVEPPREFFALVLSPPPADAGYVLGLKTRAQATIEEGVCDRAAPVRDALRGRDGCTAVADLSSLLVLDLAGSGAEALSALSAEDFLGLSGLRVLDLSGNRLSSWPSAVLAGLPNLISLRLNGNRLRELPAGALAAHPRLIGLHLADNALSALPPGAFRKLAELRRLDLSGNALSALPGDAIAGLSGLWMLRLNGNLLAELPAGLFEGVSGLRQLWLQGNPGAPFVLRLELARTDAEPWAPGPASVAARVAEGAPFALRTLLTASGEALPEGVALSVPAGAIAGEPTMLPQGEASPVWARLDGAPPVPDDECELADSSFVPCFQGIATAAGSPLALFKRAPVPVGPVAPMALRVDGDALRLDLASQFAAAPGEALSYAAESSNPSAVRVRIDNGALIAEAVGEGVATITIRATDGDGLSAALRFVVQSQRTARSRWQGWRLILLQPQDAAQ